MANKEDRHRSEPGVELHLALSDVYPLLKSYNSVAVRKTGTGKVPLHWTPRKGIHTLLFENSVRKFFAWEEAHALFCRYFDRFSVARVNSLTSSALTHLE